ncbi:protein FANTASTIC FOUR 1 [Eurytemora carolleeae]|uniref:protein FANTASTIC FOUR 1 n=1 Tax=Eurytemora carolleeae TaxID=1294199 RepID=UPI000C78A4CE|nr:protein FANTASTIC FOUR 1 [Eurytemora carolleeae]|eukprot:XP_023341444.1 protein FANTASTIC FOUR 1-like [Eurytemora affinis]
MGMLRKALVSSFISSSSNGTGVVMKTTASRRFSEIRPEDIQAVGEKVQCIVLKEEEEEEEEEQEEKEDEEEENLEEPRKLKEDEKSVVRLVNKVAGKKSNWKIVERQFVQVQQIRSTFWKL